MRRIGLLAAMLVTVLGLGCGEAAAQLPSGTTAFSPGKDLDAQSWATFIDAMRPATGGIVTFECWATDGETYSANPTWPSTCDRVAPQRFQVSKLAVAHAPRGFRAEAVAGGCGAPNDPKAGKFPTGSPADCIAEEVRRNKLSFNYIVANKLYSTAGLAAAFANPAPVAFPANAVEVKADWVPVTTLATWLKANGVPNATPQWVMANYYITTSTQAPNYSPYALVAVHFSLKTTAHPEWVWATFEHQNNPGRCDTMGCYDQFGMASNQSIAPNPTTNLQYPACTKSPQLQALFTASGMSTLANNYCLKETQVAATQGNLAILDGNSVTERITAGVPIAQASCLTCHAYAAVLSNGTISPTNPGLGSPPPIGAFTIPPGQKQIDFVWGIVNAQ
jgi:hypothetical protein